MRSWVPDDVEPVEQFRGEHAQLVREIVDARRPRPPGLMTRDPIRSDGTAAGRRSTATAMVGPFGRA